MGLAFVGETGLRLTSVLPDEGSAAIFVIASVGGGCQPGGGATCTMLPHFGQARILPMAA
ncbi:MAG: hypothetical protein ABUL64_03335 [Singulisphaera sp.]